MSRWSSGGALAAVLIMMATPARADRPLVLVDPGHGGSNTGAPTLARDLHEKDLTLALATRLAERLRHRGFDVVLSRERDTYVTLRKRVELANELRADLFVSLHGNATPAHAHRGFETFILTPEALEIDGRALRPESGARRPDTDPATALLLDDLEQGASHARAARIAAEIQRQLARVRGEEGNRGVRQGAMHVLLGATMPAVLVEVGFLDHPVEGRELLEPAVQDHLASALAEAIARSLSPSTESPTNR